MAERLRANINPRLLIWARESIGMSIRIAANRLKISSERLSDWEKGEQKPTIKQLQKCSIIYRRPLGAFFFAEPPSIPNELHDFRHRPSEYDEEKGHLVQFEIRRARQTRKRYLELLRTTREETESVTIRTNINANEESVSNQIREYLNVTYTNQTSWSDSYKALRAWIDSIERQSVLVLQCSYIPSSIMRGFSVYYPNTPIIVLNGGEAPNGRIFTLLHEFAHILLRRTGVCDTVEYRGVSSSNQTTERFCNRLSAAILVPRERLLSEFISEQSDNVENWLDNILGEAANKFKVSTQVILGRLHDLNIIDSDVYFRKLNDLVERFNISQRSEAKRESKGLYYPTKVRNLGYAYTKTVINAHNQGILSPLETCKYLDIKLKSIVGIEKMISGVR